MLKRIIPIVLLLCLIFSISVMAENINAVNDEITPEVYGQMPQGERGDMGMPQRGNMQNTNQNTQAEQETGFSGFVKTYSTPITSVILLALAFIFVIFYRRKNY